MRSRGILAGSMLALAACGGATTVSPPGWDAPGLGGTERASEEELVGDAPRVSCEPALFAGGDVELARVVDAWLDRDELGYGAEVLTLAPVEAFRVGLETIRLERRRTLSGSRTRVLREGEATVHAYVESGVVPDAPGLGRLDYVVEAEGGSIVGSFCRADGDSRTSCRYATLGADASESSFGPSLPALVDVVVVPIVRGGRAVKAIVGHAVADGVVLPALVVDYVDATARTVERVETSFESHSVFLGARVEGESLTLLGIDDRTWLAAGLTGPAHEAPAPTLGVDRACGTSGRILATTRVRIPLTLTIGGVALHSDTIVPPFELVYSEDSAGPCDARLELANREGGAGSIDGSVGGVLTPASDTDDAMEGTLTTWFGPLEASCAIER